MLEFADTDSRQSAARNRYILTRVEEMIHETPIKLLRSTERGDEALRELMLAETPAECVFCRNRIMTLCRIAATDLAAKEFDHGDGN